ncbi:MAG: hypothetical protein QXT40_03330 [Candidatus Micrarchaeia archaeon]
MAPMTSKDALEVIEKFLAGGIDFYSFRDMAYKDKTLGKKYRFLLSFHKTWYQMLMVFDSSDEVMTYIKKHNLPFDAAVESAKRYLYINRGNYPNIEKFLYDSVQGFCEVPIPDSVKQELFSLAPRIVNGSMNLSEVMYLTLVPYSYICKILFDV